MKRILVPISMMMLVLMSGNTSGASLDGDLWKNPKPVLEGTCIGDVTRDGGSKFVPTAAYNEVSDEVYNFRCLLGGGRKIIRHDCIGEDPPSLEVVFTRDVDRPEMRLFDALSMDNGVMWNIIGPLSDESLAENRDRNHIIDFNDELTYLTYTEQDGNPVSGLTNMWWTSDLFKCFQAFFPFTEITDVDSLDEFYTMLAMVESSTAYMSFIDFDDGNPYTTYFRYSDDNGETWSNNLNITATIGTDGFDMDGMDGPLMIDADADFIAALAMVVLDPTFADAHGFLQNVTYPAYTQSIDGGESWDDLRLVFGNEGSEYPHGHSGDPDIDALISYIGGVQDAAYTAFNNCQDNVAVTSDGMAHMTFTMTDTTFGYHGVWHVLVDNGIISHSYVGFPENNDMEGESGVAFMSSIAETDAGHVVVGWTEFMQGTWGGSGDICCNPVPAGEADGNGPVNVTQTLEGDETYQRIVDMAVPTSVPDEYYVDWLFLYYGDGGYSADSTLWHLQTTITFELSPLSMTITPDETNYGVGDTLGCTVFVTNNTDTTIYFQMWAEAEGPGGHMISPLIGPQDESVGPQQMISTHLSHPIPEDTPGGGPYIFRVKVGEYPGVVITEAGFQFHVFSFDIALEILPDTTHFYRGETLDFTVTVTNNLNHETQFTIWSEGETPWGLIVSPLLGPIDHTIGPSAVISQHVSQEIPPAVIFGGPYIYIGKIGEYPDDVFAEDSFEFYVVPPGMGLSDR